MKVVGKLFSSANNFDLAARLTAACFIWLIPLAVSLKVTCNYRIVAWSFIKDHYQCHISELRVDSPDEVVDSIDGEHLSGNADDDVKSIAIENQVCMFMPQKFDSFFKNIEGIQISTSNLESITQADLKPFPNLKQLILNSNKIVELSADLFEFNKKLIFLDFSHNNILLIPENIFSPIENLESIDFSENVCISKTGYNEAGIQEIVSEIVADCHANYTWFYALSNNTDLYDIANITELNSQTLEESLIANITDLFHMANITELN